jgi:hypothetical protein
MECINYADAYTVIYDVGDTVALDDERFTYVGTRYDELNGCTVHLYEPVNGKSKEYLQTSADNFIEFLFKVPVKAGSINNPEAPERKRSFTSKMFGWFLESNRWKHFLYAIPAGAINFWLAIGLALGMEFKDAQHGGKFDWVDAACTAVGGFVGAALSWRLLGDYVLHYLIKLIF